MRWDALFDDMEQQLAAASAQDQRQEAADLTRSERASVLLTDRLRGGLGSSVTLTVRSGTAVRGELTDVGAAWVLIVDGRRQHLVPVGAIATAAGLPPTSAPPPGTVVRRLGLGHALRAVARDRDLVRVTTVSGAAPQGRIDAVGADHLELAGVFEDSGRPNGERMLVTFTSVEVLTSG